MHLGPITQEKTERPQMWQKAMPDFLGNYFPARHIACEWREWWGVQLIICETAEAPRRPMPQLPTRSKGDCLLSDLLPPSTLQTAPCLARRC